MILAHVNETGNGFELDDLASNSPDEDRDVSDKISEIHHKYRNSTFPIGTSNPASFDDLRALAEDLKRQGR